MISPNAGHANNYYNTHIYRTLNTGTVLVINYIKYAIIATCYELGIISPTLPCFTNEETEAYVGEVNQPGTPGWSVPEPAGFEPELDARTHAPNDCSLQPRNSWSTSPLKKLQSVLQRHPVAAFHRHLMEKKKKMLGKSLAGC